MNIKRLLYVLEVLQSIFSYEKILYEPSSKNLPQIGYILFEHSFDGIHMSPHVVSKITVNFCPGFPTNI